MSIITPGARERPATEAFGKRRSAESALIAPARPRRYLTLPAPRPLLHPPNPEPAGTGSLPVGRPLFPWDASLSRGSAFGGKRRSPERALFHPSISPTRPRARHCTHPSWSPAGPDYLAPGRARLSRGLESSTPCKGKARGAPDRLLAPGPVVASRIAYQNQGPAAVDKGFY
jgi:hypothetical protein